MTLPVVRLHRGRARPFWHGCPIVFSGAVAAVEGAPRSGAWVEVRDDADRPIGQGFFNPDSAYRVRILRLARESTIPNEPAGCVVARVGLAAGVRRALELPGAETDCLRLVNSEGDRLSGLVVDVFGDVAVAQASARWVLDEREVVEAAIREGLGRDVRVVHRVAPVLREEGFRPAAGRESGAVGMAASFQVRENGLRYGVDPSQGQKTGFYLDQRENRLLVRGLARGGRVLDLFTFSGGFALNAAAGGATEVLGVDSSSSAIAAAEENARINGLDGIARFQATDVAAVLGQGGTWDLVVCDPPKYAARRSELDAAMKRYLGLNRAAIQSVVPGGLLVTCSCSSAVRREPFLEMLREAAAQAERRLSVLHVRGAAPDHPIDPAWPEGEYLKCVVAVVG